MNWTDRIFRYCERGSDPAFWAEPFNAATNGAFIIAAIAAASHLIRIPSAKPRWPEWGLTGLLFAIGIGSFLFHTYANRWSALADTAPIGLFMVAYLAYALSRFAGLSWLAVALLLALFAAALKMAGDVSCTTGLLPVTEASRAPCLNGTAGYTPALGALALVGLGLALQGHRAARALLAAALLFFISMLARTLDWELCASWRVLGGQRGTHFIWHLLNALTLYILVRAAIRHGTAHADT